MFGNGKDQPAQIPPDAAIEAPSSSSLWGDMFGVGSLFKVITDPALGAHAAAMMNAITESAKASSRIERKLNRLLAALGQEVEDANVGSPGIGPPALLAADGANGGRGLAPASGAPDNGGRGIAPHDGGSSRPSGMVGEPVRDKA